MSMDDLNLKVATLLCGAAVETRWKDGLRSGEPGRSLDDHVIGVLGIEHGLHVSDHSHRLDHNSARLDVDGRAPLRLQRVRDLQRHYVGVASLRGGVNHQNEPIEVGVRLQTELVARGLEGRIEPAGETANSDPRLRILAGERHTGHEGDSDDVVSPSVGVALADVAHRERGLCREAADVERVAVLHGAIENSVGNHVLLVLAHQLRRNRDRACLDRDVRRALRAVRVLDVEAERDLRRHPTGDVQDERVGRVVPHALRALSVSRSREQICLVARKFNLVSGNACAVQPADRDDDIALVGKRDVGRPLHVQVVRVGWVWRVLEDVGELEHSCQDRDRTVLGLLRYQHALVLCDVLTIQLH
eukprot:971083-Rhodomonas_salina.2